jgi:hypothetical protein
MMGLSLYLKLAAAALLLAGGFYGGLRWQAGPLEKARADLVLATRVAAVEQAARRELTAQCEARDAASSDAQNRRDAVQGAVERALREAHDAEAAGDDGLSLLLGRVRAQNVAPSEVPEQ